MPQLEPPAPSDLIFSTPGIDEIVPPALAEVLESLGPHALHLVCAAGQLATQIGEPIVHGVGEPVNESEAGILLLTGSRSTHSVLVDTIRAAGKAGYCAVVLKAFGDELSGLVHVAEEAGVALLTTPDEMAWRHLDALLTALRSAAVSAGSYSSVGLGDVFALANAIASSVGGATTIEEYSGQVIAYSNLPGHEIDETRRQSILGRQTPYQPMNRERYRALLQDEKPVFFASPSPDIAGRLAVAVRAGTELLCLIWVLTDRPPLAVGAEARLMDAARATALHLLRGRGQRDPERWHRAEALRSLLDGGMTPQAASTQLGIAYDLPTTVIGFAQVGDHPDPMVAAARIMDVVTLYCESWHPSALCVADAGVVYALLPGDVGADSPERLIRLGQDVATAIRRSTNSDVLIAVGSRAAHLSEVPQSRRMADRVLEVLASRARHEEGPRIASVEQVHTGVVLRTLADLGATSPDMLSRSVQAILDHDRVHGTSYAETVLAYLGSFGDVTRAAESLQVHENTMRYRVRRVQELFDLDLTNGDQVLTTWLQLRLLALEGPSGKRES